VVGSLFMSRPDKICKTHECIIPLRKACRQQKGVEENWSTIWTAIRTQWDFVAPNIVCPAQHTMYDWMHVLVASGGVAQYEVNGFLAGASWSKSILFDLQWSCPSRGANF
jgi:hypothetical protein